MQTGKHVVVIGGGDTGSDCVGTSNRHGARERHAVRADAEAAREHENKPLTWPYWPIKLRTSSSSMTEGCEREFAIATKEFIGEEGQGQVQGEVAEDRAPGMGGREDDLKWPGTEFELLKADLVLLAMGFVSPCMQRAEELWRGQGCSRQRQGQHVDASGGYKTNVRQGLRGRRHAPWPIARGLGHSRRAPGGPRGRCLLDGPQRLAALIHTKLLLVARR